MDTKVYPAGYPQKHYVQMMFNKIAKHYDFLNHFLSFGFDFYWRKKVLEILKEHKSKNILDIATGTADMAIKAASLNPEKITAVDISEEMIKKGVKKIRSKKLQNVIEILFADSEDLPFDCDVFDAITVCFGVRNFENVNKGLEEMYRVLQNNGIVIILEFSQPSKVFFKNIYFFYFTKILPFIGRLISKDKSAYTYLPKSVFHFIHGQEFVDLMLSTGFKNVRLTNHTMGIVSIYIGEKHDTII